MNRYVLAYLAATTALLFLNVMACDKGDDSLPEPDGCETPTLYSTFAEVPESASGATHARLKDGCVELVWGVCGMTFREVAIQRSAVAIHPPIYSVSLVLTPDGSQCVYASYDSASFSLAQLKERDQEFDLRFQGLDDLVIEVR